MATDFAVMLHRFLISHLAGMRGCSPNTIASYRDAFKLLIAFFSDVRSIPPDSSPSTASTTPPSPGS
jgi:integrase/recombinase XerD